MVFWIKESDIGEWSWRLHSSAMKQFIAKGIVACESEELCVKEIALMKNGMPEAIIYTEPRDAGSQSQ